MPNSASAKKELRKSINRRQRNSKTENNLKDLIKKSRRAIEAKDSSAKELVMKTLRALDKAAGKGVIKKNASNRKKSRLSKKLNQAFK
ncbi:MAG: 30S ribosomal protein S20 [Patescibacteria group bacterium]|jgi:small subunit ribosomal protein S20